MRFLAALSIARISPAPEAVPVLAETLLDQAVDKSVREAAAWGLETSGELAVSVLPALIRALSDSDYEVRSHVLFSLAHIGPRARSAVPTITPLLHDSDERIRRAATFTLKSITKSK